jgi:hypothetical protein
LGLDGSPDGKRSRNRFCTSARCNRASKMRACDSTSRARISLNSTRSRICVNLLAGWTAALAFFAGIRDIHGCRNGINNRFRATMTAIVAAVLPMAASVAPCRRVNLGARQWSPYPSDAPEELTPILRIAAFSHAAELAPQALPVAAVLFIQISHKDAGEQCSASGPGILSTEYTAFFRRTNAG